jgi:hypothetical protein
LMPGPPAQTPQLGPLNNPHPPRHPGRLGLPCSRRHLARFGLAGTGSGLCGAKGRQAYGSSAGRSDGAGDDRGQRAAVCICPGLTAGDRQLDLACRLGPLGGSLPEAGSYQGHQALAVLTQRAESCAGVVGLLCGAWRGGLRGAVPGWGWDTRPLRAGPSPNCLPQGPSPRRLTWYVDAELARAAPALAQAHRARGKVVPRLYSVTVYCPCEFSKAPELLPGYAVARCEEEQGGRAEGGGAADRV